MNTWTQITGGQSIPQGDQVVSTTGSAVLTVTDDGTIAILVNGDPVWAGTNQGSVPGPYTLNLSSQGTLTVNGATNELVWSTGATGLGGMNVSLTVNDIGIAYVTQQTILWQSPAPVSANEFKLQIANDDGLVGFEADYVYDGSTAQSGAASGQATTGGAATALAAAPMTQKRPAWKLKSQQWLNPAWKPKTKTAVGASLGSGSEGATDPVSTALQVATFAWQFIKDNAPVTNFQGQATSVLSPLDANSLDYANAVTAESDSITIKGTVWPTNVTQFKVKVALAGSYQATPPSGKGVPNGYYLPNLYAKIASCTVNWPYSCSAHASVMQPVNTGTETDVNVQVDIQCDFLFTSFVDDMQATVVFRANGAGGFTIESADM